MEEILASIRKIIAEDDQPADEPEVAELDAGDFEDDIEDSAPELDVLTAEEDPSEDSIFEEFDLSDLTATPSPERTEVVAEPFEIETEAEEDVEFASELDRMFEEVETEAVATVTRRVLEPEPEPELQPIPEPVVAPQVVRAAPTPKPQPERTSMASLTEDKTADAAAGALARLVSRMDMGSENTLEGLVRELLKPMLKEWLDENLPRIVEEKVEAEVERISRLAR